MLRRYTEWGREVMGKFCASVFTVLWITSSEKKKYHWGKWWKTLHTAASSCLFALFIAYLVVWSRQWPNGAVRFLKAVSASVLFWESCVPECSYRVRDNVGQYARGDTCLRFCPVGNEVWHLDWWNKAIRDLGSMVRQENVCLILQRGMNLQGKQQWYLAVNTTAGFTSLYT